MKSYTAGRNQYGVWSKNIDTSNLSSGDLYANDDYRTLCALKDWPFLERLRTLTSIASTQAYNLPYDCDQVREVTVVPTGQTVRWTPDLSPSAKHWDNLNLTQFTSDDARWYFVRAGQILLWPTPASTGNSIYITQKSRVIDLTQADYTTGAITTIAASGTVVTGSGTSWSAAMVGRYIKITPTDLANGGDGLWYEIAGVSSATSLTLVRAYGGTAISGGSAAYIIGQMPLLPESFHDMPWLMAAGMYWGKEADPRSDFFLNQHGALPTAMTPATGKVAELIRTWSSPTTDMVIDSGEDDSIINPNLTISL